MNPQDDLQISVTKEKLADLKKCYETVSQGTEGDEFVRKLTLRSLKKAINQFTEDLIRLEAHAHGSVK
jgi:hypothetical protein